MADSSSSSKGDAVSVLFVCLGNICRSPMAEAVFNHTLSTTTSESLPTFSAVDSAGTGGYHIGSQPDSRTLSVLKRNGITGYRHQARQVSSRDFEEFGYIFGMDQDNVDDLQAMRQRIVTRRKKDGSADAEIGLAKIMLFGAHGGKSKSEEVGDPYYGAGADGFEVAFEQMQRFSKGFLKSLEGQ